MKTLPALPEVIYDRVGMKIDLSLPSWPIHDPVRRCTMDWRNITHITGDALHALKLYICHRLTKQAPNDVHNAFREIRTITSIHHAPLHNISDINHDLLVFYRETLRGMNCEYRFVRIRAWYAWMGAMDFPGVDQSLLIELSKWRLPGNRKGEAVMTRDAADGPLSSDEYSNLLTTVRHDEKASQRLAAVLLCLELGLNSKHILLLEERDLHRFIDSSDGTPRFQLDVPRIKKRTFQRVVRRRSVSSKLGIVLDTLVSANGTKFGGPNPQRPIFCKTNGFRRQSAAGKKFFLHSSTGGICRMVRQYAIQNNIRSERTNGALHLTPRRLRYTYATRMAEQGVPPALLADLLDHSDLQNVMVYVNSRAEAVERLDKALERDAGPVFRRFVGRLVESEASASPSDVSSRVYGQTRVLPSLGGIGTCGRKTLCNLYPPYSCYLCSHFQPWKNASHEKMLEDILAFRETLIAQAGGAADRIPHQLDEVVRAIQDVVELQQGPPLNQPVTER